MQFKTTKKLFEGIYQYKIVLTCAGSSLFRAGQIDSALTELRSISFENNKVRYHNHIKTQDDLDYALALATELSKLKDFDLRVESPWISIYTNSLTDINKLVSIGRNHVKYISKPPDNTSLDAGTVIMPKMDFDYRITLGKTIQEHSAFISWAESNKKCKLTKSCIRDLSKTRSWGGTHFYITGDNNLLMARMHLGGSISKVERIIKN